MYRNRRRCLLFLMLIVLLTSCDKAEQSEEQAKAQQAMIDDLNLKLTASNLQIEKLTAELQGKDHVKTGLEQAIQDYPWLNKLNSPSKWDKIVISRYENDPAEKTITDPVFLASIQGLFTLRSTATVSYPSGYQSDIDSYTYELFEGERKYTIKVVGRGVIEAGRPGLYFDVDGSVHQLGAAFMPKQRFIQHDGLISKMAASGAVKRNEAYIQFSGFRVQSRIAPLLDGKLLKNRPEIIGDRLDRFTFYYYGIELVMDIYQDYVHLTGDGAEEWYSLPDAGIRLSVEAG